MLHKRGEAAQSHPTLLDPSFQTQKIILHADRNTLLVGVNIATSSEGLRFYQRAEGSLTEEPPARYLRLKNGSARDDASGESNGIRIQTESIPLDPPP